MRLKGPSKTTRAGAALVAVLVVAGFLHLMRGGALPAQARSTAVTLRLLPVPPAPARPDPEPITTSVVRARTAPRPPTLHAQPDLPAPSAAVAPAPQAITLPPALPASAPLDLGTRSAIARSKGSTRQMAEASGQVLDTPKTTAAQQLAGGIQDAGIESCFGAGATKHEHPALAMGGLLAAPGLVVAALSGRCKP
jgi:hypothetical protein